MVSSRDICWSWLPRELGAAGSPVVVVALGVGWGRSLPGTYVGAACRGLWGKGVWMRRCWLGFAGSVTLPLLLCRHIDSQCEL